LPTLAAHEREETIMTKQSMKGYGTVRRSRLLRGEEDRLG
jgi:hypothetical protein